MSSTFEEETGAQGPSEAVVLIEKIQEDDLISIETEVKDVEIRICTQWQMTRIGREKQRKIKIADIIPREICIIM